MIFTAKGGGKFVKVEKLLWKNTERAAEAPRRAAKALWRLVVANWGNDARRMVLHWDCNVPWKLSRIYHILNGRNPLPYASKEARWVRQDFSFGSRNKVGRFGTLREDWGLEVVETSPVCEWLNGLGANLGQRWRRQRCLQHTRETFFPILRWDAY